MPASDDGGVEPDTAGVTLISVDRIVRFASVDAGVSYRAAGARPARSCSLTETMRYEDRPHPRRRRQPWPCSAACGEKKTDTTTATNADGSMTTTETTTTPPTTDAAADAMKANADATVDAAGQKADAMVDSADKKADAMVDGAKADAKAMKEGASNSA